MVKFLRLAPHFNSHVDTKRGSKMHAMSSYLHSWSDLLFKWRDDHREFEWMATPCIFAAKLIQMYYRRHFYRKMHQKLTTIDIKSSYATPHACSLYEGFPNKITDFRPTDKDEGPGFYLIHRLDFSYASEQFRGTLL